jgi:O-acetyl-ADP-ribose deacetylase (regulator of RNase III)
MAILKGLLRYRKGDATFPQGGGHKIIMHVCNNLGGWGAGFVVALSKRWKLPEQEYRKWFAGKQNFKLGEAQFVFVQTDVTVANMLAQHGLRYNDDEPAVVELKNLEACLEKVYLHAFENSSTVHAPRIASGLAGLQWEQVEPLIKKHLVDKGIDVTIYDLE